jgi:hypothetical protein
MDLNFKCFRYLSTMVLQQQLLMFLILNSSKTSEEVQKTKVIRKKNAFDQRTHIFDIVVDLAVK